MIGIIRRGIDHAKELDDLFHFVQTAEVVFERTKNCEATLFGGMLALFVRKVGAEFPGFNRVRFVPRQDWRGD